MFYEKCWHALTETSASLFFKTNTQSLYKLNLDTEKSFCMTYPSILWDDLNLSQ